MKNCFFTGKILGNAKATTLTEWYDVSKQRRIQISTLDLVTRYGNLTPERPDLAEPFRKAIEEVANSSPTQKYLLSYINLDY